MRLNLFLKALVSDSYMLISLEFYVCKNISFFPCYILEYFFRFDKYATVKFHIGKTLCWVFKCGKSNIIEKTHSVEWSSIIEKG